MIALPIAARPAIAWRLTGGGITEITRADLTGLSMKKIYQKPVLMKKGQLSDVTASIPPSQIKAT